MNDTSIHTKKDSHFDSIKEGGNDQYPLVAIVILNWNGKAFLNKFLPSVLESTYKNKRIIFKHILPNVMGPVVVIAASNFASAILMEAGLSFLGIGAQPPVPSWGEMINAHHGYILMDKAYLAFVPGLAIMLLVLSFMLVGNGLRDALDTKISDDKAI